MENDLGVVSFTYECHQSSVNGSKSVAPGMIRTDETTLMAGQSHVLYFRYCKVCLSDRMQFFVFCFG